MKSVLHYRRPGVWLSAAAVLLCAALAMTFLTEPKPARTGVSPETASGQTDPDRLRETSSKALIVSSTLDPAAQRISYTVQLTEEPEDWIAQKQWYGVASYADVEIFYPEAGSYYRQTDVPHLRFYEWGLADQPTDLESQRPDTDTRYDDYIVDSVTVLSVDGVQRSTFRRWASPCCWRRTRVTPAAACPSTPGCNNIHYITEIKEGGKAVCLPDTAFRTPCAPAGDRWHFCC